MTGGGSAAVSYGHRSRKAGATANARLSSDSWRWHSTSSAGVRSAQIGSPIPRTGRPEPWWASANSRHAGMIRAGLRPISAMSTNWASRASPLSAPRSSSILAGPTMTRVGCPAATPSRTKGRVPSRKPSGPAYSRASWENAPVDRCSAAASALIGVPGTRLRPMSQHVAGEPPSREPRPAVRTLGAMASTETRVSAPEKLLLAAPRGYCAGVDRAVQTVEHALDLYGAPVYVRKEIVHNKHVVEELRERGAIFVDQETEVPEGSTTVFSAHGVAPSVHANAAERKLFAIDATCPLVTKVHVEAKKFAAEGYTIVLIGHAGHEEVEGTMGEAPEDMLLIETEEDVDRLEVENPDKLAYLTQTTLSVDETRTIINRLRSRFPNVIGPRTDDICYATTNRQAAVKQMAEHCDLVLVIGSRNSSNSNRLVEVARDHGAESYLIDNADQVDDAWLADARVVGISSGASAPELLVQQLVDFFRARGTEDVSELDVIHEDVRFMLPKTIRKALADRK